MNDELRDIEAILDRIREAIDTARPVPLSASVMVNREELLQQVDDILEHLPDEFRKARWVLKEREEVIDRARREAEEIIAEAREEANKIVSQQEIVRKAAKTAQNLIEESKDAARSKILDAEDYIDQKLGQFEVALHRTIDTVNTARRKLHRGAADDVYAAPPDSESSSEVIDPSAVDRFPTPPPQHFDVVDQTGEHFFDQDAL
ncbi:MAG: hypothetical protein U0U69_09640 [Acidimicrobiia bacterium]